MEELGLEIICFDMIRQIHMINIMYDLVLFLCNQKKKKELHINICFVKFCF